MSGPFQLEPNVDLSPNMYFLAHISIHALLMIIILSFQSHQTRILWELRGIGTDCPVLRNFKNLKVPLKITTPVVQVNLHLPLFLLYYAQFLFPCELQSLLTCIYLYFCGVLLIFPFHVNVDGLPVNVTLQIKIEEGN